ncbi:hypothetical protein TNCV_1637581 [Trichonephila clavipes]|nr:hypothetical protein TNCV_1637581 [Trichonephila clavipes]
MRNVPISQHSRFKMGSSQGQVEVVTWFVEFNSATCVHSKWDTTTLPFGSEKKFPGRWMKRGSPIPWPPRYLGITPLVEKWNHSGHSDCSSYKSS